MISSETAVADFDAPAEERQYWIDKLAGGPRPSAPRPDHRRPDGRCERSATEAFEIRGEVFDQLVRLTSGEPFLEYAALAAALTACLYRYTQGSPVVIGCPAMRSAGETADLHNVVPIVSEVDGQMTFRQLLLGVRQTLLDAHARQRYPFERLLEDLDIPAPSNRGPLFDVALVYRALHHQMPETGNDLTLTFRREPGSLQGTVTFSPRLYEPATIERFGRHLVRLLGAGLEDPGAALAELDMLTDEERHRLLVDGMTSRGTIPGTAASTSCSRPTSSALRRAPRWSTATGVSATASSTGAPTASPTTSRSWASPPTLRSASA